MSEPVAAPKRAPLELKLKIMQRNWSYPEFREVLFKEARESKDHKHASVYRRLYAYLRALEMHQQGLDRERIREAIGNEINFRPPETDLSCWLRGVCTPLGRMSVFNVRLPEVGLVMGLILSDGNEYQRRCRGTLSMCQRFYNADEEVLEEFRGACNTLGLGVGKRRTKRCQCLTAYSVLLYLLLKRFDEFIVKAPASVQLAFLRGLWLGDGQVSSGVKLHNTDLRIIDTVSTLLKMHGVEHTIQGPYPPHSPGRKPIYRIYVTDRSRESFLRLVGLAEGPPRPPLHV